MNVTEILDQINLYLTQSNAYALDFLLPGLAKEDIDTQTGDGKVILPEDVYKLYQWRNGIANIYDHNFNHQPFFSFGIFYSLQSAIELYKSHSIVDQYWSDCYFPLFTNGGGDFILLNIDEQSEENGMVYLYSPSINLSIEPVSIYDSIKTMLDTILLCYQKQAYFFENRELAVNTKLEFEIGQLKNPHSLFWQLEESDF